MTIHKLSDTEIQIRVVPKRLRWPESGTTVAWTKAHDCVDALQNLVRSVDIACVEAEQDRQLSAGGIARRRAELCNHAMTNLASFIPFQIAEKAVTENIDLLERLTDRDSKEAQMHQILTKALQDLREGVESTQRMLLERCKMRADTLARL